MYCTWEIILDKNVPNKDQKFDDFDNPVVFDGASWKEMFNLHKILWKRDENYNFQHPPEVKSF